MRLAFLRGHVIVETSRQQDAKLDAEKRGKAQCPGRRPKTHGERSDMEVMAAARLLG